MEYVYAQRNPSPHAGVLGQLNNVDDDYELAEGVPRLETWPTDATMMFDSDFGVKLDDVIECLDSLLVASERFCTLLNEEGLTHVEILPLTLIDLKGRPLQEPYFIVHPTDLPDALDLDASGVTFNEIVPEDIDDVERLAIDKASIKPGRRLFRLERYTQPLLFERQLAHRIEAEGFTGIRFAPIDEFDRFSMI